MSRASLTTGLTRKSMAFATTVAIAHALGAMNSLVLIERDGGYDEATREYDLEKTVTIYDNALVPGSGGEAGVVVTDGPSTMDIGDEPAYFDALTVYIPQHSPNLPRIDDLIFVMATPDADLVDRVFRVTSVANGGRILASNRISAVGVAPSKQWGSP